VFVPGTPFQQGLMFVEAWHYSGLLDLAGNACQGQRL